MDVENVGSDAVKRKPYHIVSLSGGKDSTAMLLMMLEKNMQVDEIIFCDTGVEFPEMYEHLKEVETYTGRKITTLKNPKGFEYYLLHHEKKKGKQKGRIGYGFPLSAVRWCTGILKMDVLKKYNTELKRQGYNPIHHVGIAFDEPKRITDDPDKRYPLYEWGITEAEALQYCKDRGFTWGGLYDIFDRVSCWCCPLQTFSELKKLHDHFPDLWQQLRVWDEQATTKFRYRVKDSPSRMDEFEIRFRLQDEFDAKGFKTTNLQCKEYGQAVKEEVMKTYGTLDYIGLRTKRRKK